MNQQIAAARSAISQYRAKAVAVAALALLTAMVLASSLRPANAACSVAKMHALALEHSRDMARRDTLDHAGFYDRYRRGEASEVTAAGCATEACAYAGWHKSPLHAAALHTPGCRAIASAVSRSGTRYWTLVIGQDLKPKSKKKTAWSWSSGGE